MAEKILFTARVNRHLEAFHVPYMQLLKDMGYEIHTAAGGSMTASCVDRHFDIDFARLPFELRNIRAYRELKRVVDGEGYKLIHCHTPTSSVITRLAARKARKRGTTVLYTAHGFRFFGAASLADKVIFRNIERFSARFTDHIWTINREDYDAISRYHFKCDSYTLTRGVGINGERFKPVSRERKLELRHEFGIPDNAFVMIFPAMFIGRKHHDKLLEVMRILTEAVSDMYLLLPGEGEILEQVRESAAEFGDHVKFVGHVSNMEDYYAASDIDVTMSRLEGLATHIIEAMSVGLPCVATMMRGHSDIVSDGVNGFLVAPGDTAAFADRVLRLYNDRATLAEFGGHAGATAKKFWVENIIPDYKRLYSEVLGIDDEL